MNEYILNLEEQKQIEDDIQKPNHMQTNRFQYDEDNNLKKSLKEKHKQVRKKQKDDISIITDEEKAVNKLMILSSKVDNSLLRQIVENYLDEDNAFNNNEQNSQIYNNGRNGWEEEFQINYCQSDLKNFSTQIQQLDDFDKKLLQNSRGKQYFTSCKSDKVNRKSSDIQEEAISLNGGCFIRNFKQNQMDIKRQERCRTIHDRSCQQLTQVAEELCNCNRILKQQNKAQSNSIEKSVIHVKSIYYKKQNQLSSNEKFIQMLKKQSQNLNQQLQYQQNQGLYLANNRTNQVTVLKENPLQIKQMDNSEENQNSLTQDRNDKYYYSNNRDPNELEIISNSSQKQNLQSQNRAILEYYCLPSSSSQHNKYYISRQKTHLLNEKENSNQSDQLSINPIKLIPLESQLNCLTISSSSLLQTQKTQLIRNSISNPFRKLKLQTKSPQSQQKQNTQAQGQQFIDSNTQNSCGERNGSMPFRKIKQLYQTSRPSNISNTSQDMSDLSSSLLTTYQISSSQKQLYLKTPKSVINNGSESTLEQTRQTRCQEFSQLNRSINSSAHESSLPQLDKNQQIHYLSRTDAVKKIIHCKKVTNHRQNNHKIENVLVQLTSAKKLEKRNEYNQIIAQNTQTIESKDEFPLREQNTLNQQSNSNKITVQTGFNHSVLELKSDLKGQEKILNKPKKSCSSKQFLLNKLADGESIHQNLPRTLSNDSLLQNDNIKQDQIQSFQDLNLCKVKSIQQKCYQGIQSQMINLQIEQNNPSIIQQKAFSCLDQNQQQSNNYLSNKKSHQILPYKSVNQNNDLVYVNEQETEKQNFYQSKSINLFGKALPEIDLVKQNSPTLKNSKGIIKKVLKQQIQQNLHQDEEQKIETQNNAKINTQEQIRNDSSPIQSQANAINNNQMGNIIQNFSYFGTRQMSPLGKGELLQKLVLIQKEDLITNSKLESQEVKLPIIYFNYTDKILKGDLAQKDKFE